LFIVYLALSVSGMEDASENEKCSMPNKTMFNAQGLIIS
jgi:hypothetical protein